MKNKEIEKKKSSYSTFFSYQITKYIIWNIAGRITESSGSAMRKYHRCLTHRQRIPHGPYRNMRQIHEHS